MMSKKGISLSVALKTPLDTNQMLESSTMKRRDKVEKTLAQSLNRKMWLAAVSFLKSRRFFTPRMEHLLVSLLKMLNILVLAVVFIQLSAFNQHLIKLSLISDSRNSCLTLKALSKEKAWSHSSTYARLSSIDRNYIIWLSHIWFIMPMLKLYKHMKRRKLKSRIKNWKFPLKCKAVFLA